MDSLVYKDALDIIKKGITLLPDDKQDMFRTQANKKMTYDAIEEAEKVANTDERKALLEAFTLQTATQVITLLWQLQLLTKELENKFRALPPLDEAADKYAEFENDRTVRTNALVEKEREIGEEKRDIDIFKGVLNGMSSKKSEEAYDKYQKQALEAVTNK